MLLATLLFLLLSPCHLLAISCNFETDFCEWEQNASNVLQWIRDNGHDEKLPYHGPKYDHTLNGKGFYLFVNNTSAEVKDQRARLTSFPQTSTSANQCFSFWYHMYGPQIGTLSLKVLQQGQNEELLWTRTGTHGNEWRRGFHTIPPQNKHFQLIFEATLISSTGDISIDDVNVVGGECEAQGMCSFEANSCQYTSTGMQRWERLPGDPKNSSNRPITDHTTETTHGHFMVADTSLGVLPINQALIMFSPVQDLSDTGVCLQFWFQMNGEIPGTLNIYVEEGTQEKRKVWRARVDQGLTWSLGRVNIRTAQSWKLIFEAIGGGATMSHIAIDDVTLHHTECPRVGTCDFELDPCGWKNVLNPKLDSKDWDWNNGQTPSYFKGPEVDHTLRTSQGHYMFVDLKALNNGDTAWFLSEHLPPTRGSCLAFCYHVNISKLLMHGALKVFRYHADQEPVIWEAKDSQSAEWRCANITVESSVVFQVGFKAVKSDIEEVGSVAIDDVVYNPGINCHGVKTDEVFSGYSHAAGIAAGVMILLAVIAFLIVGIVYWVKKTRISLPGSTSGSSRQFGFENLFYRSQN
ncbi:apical endosomal glycoprotein [Scyliorhinus canicula]|uniref:apical endosomal glycoprotein n=1 Tax=Scyliorhinus canicula TaxID=7830 RepID=UPI0018F2DCAF|nr:apical endosomal glycoprotein [Scyliorhinus canicula]